jgi:hypothetical protein
MVAYKTKIKYLNGGQIIFSICLPFFLYGVGEYRALTRTEYARELL